MGPETILLVTHLLCPRPEGSQENEGLHRWRIQEWKCTQAPLVDQWVWGCQDYRQLLKDAGVIPSQESFVAWTLSRTVNVQIVSKQLKTSELNIEKETN